RAPEGPRGCTRRIPRDAARRQRPALRVRALSPGPHPRHPRQDRRGQGDAREGQGVRQGHRGRRAGRSTHREPRRMKKLLFCALLGCGGGALHVSNKHADAMSAENREDLGEDRLALKWKFETADRLTEIAPQEFAAAAVGADTLYIGSASGTFYALAITDGHVRWKKEIGAVACAPLIDRGFLYIPTSDGFVICVDAQTGQEKWRYQSRGAIEQRPDAAGDLIIFSNEA